jgi:hypothetical protein
MKYPPRKSADSLFSQQPGEPRLDEKRELEDIRFGLAEALGDRDARVAYVPDRIAPAGPLLRKAPIRRERVHGMAGLRPSVSVRDFNVIYCQEDGAC